MKLFNGPLLRRFAANFELSEDVFQAASKVIDSWVWSLENSDLDKTKEVSVQGPFLTRIFGDSLGYEQAGGGVETHHLVAELGIKQDSADAGLGFYTSTLKTTRVVVELKDAHTSLDKKQISRANRESPVEQAYRYANKQDSCKWIVVSNFKEIRLYSKYRSMEYYESFKLEELKDPVKLRQFYYLFARENLISEVGNSVVDDLFDQSTDASKDISERFYQQYRDRRRNLFEDLVSVNPTHGPTLLLEKAQKILDRLIFVCFCEDSSIRLLPPKTIRRDILDAAESSFEADDQKLWRRCMGLFGGIDKGLPTRVPPINAYNGGLFAPDPILDSLVVRDSVLKPILALEEYDFDSELDVNLLGHVFERSIADLEGIRAEIDGIELDKEETKRKKDGIYYTPAYITKYLVENTLGAYLAEHPERLETLKVLDPACGSGAFLNQAHGFLKGAYQQRRAELEAAALAEQADAQADAAERNAKKRKRTSRVGGLLEVTDSGTVEVRRDLSTEWAYVNDAVLLRHIYGVDLNEESAEITKLSLWLKTAKADEPLRNLDSNIRVGNSLIEDPKVAGLKAFDWSTEFTTETEAGEFDIIVGNPPWVFARSGKLDPKDKDYFYKTYEVAEYQLNLYALFIERAFRQLKEGGRFGFIVPNTWLTIPSYEKLRRFILEKTSDVQIVNIYDKVFTDANVDCCLIVFSKGAPNEVSLGEMREQKIEVIPSVAPGKITDLNSAIININQLKDAGASELLAKMEAAAKPLSDFANVVSGIKAYEVGKGVPPQTKEMKDARIYHSRSKDGDDYVPYLEGRDVRRYAVEWSGQWIKFGDNLAAKRKIDFTAPRILVRQIPSKPPYCINGVYTVDHQINDINSMVIFDFKIDARAVLAVLNSRPMSYWFDLTFDKLQRGLFPQFKVRELKTFPIPAAIEDYEDRLIALVDHLTDGGKTLASELDDTIQFMAANYSLPVELCARALADLNWDKLKPKVKESDREEVYKFMMKKGNHFAGLRQALVDQSVGIDGLVYEMFGLAEDERDAIRTWG